ncbi:hypothetical protein CLU96_3765 [Chryseobacterium sp. 52]|uniref:hypothetical protein n=1 Tax=Chryseobacterium sp. 52 TaxID=2035213 RepID=UPI000C194156|nr:hypothetical protein [Chryseobacterium sp. 52]PIF46725.1 hypothetical protein CLU96_3765 [Chryseobacterium sp. 52]
MNWIIRSTKMVKFHTNLQEVLKPIYDDLKIYDWIMTDLDFIADVSLPINFDFDFFILNPEQFEQIYTNYVQIIWGVIAAVHRKTEINTAVISNLSAEDPKVWESDHFLIPDCIFEITAIDSGYTIIKFKDKHLSDQFKMYFQEQAMDLQTFNEKYINRKSE